MKLIEFKDIVFNSERFDFLHIYNSVIAYNFSLNIGGVTAYTFLYDTEEARDSDVMKLKTLLNRS